MKKLTVLAFFILLRISASAQCTLDTISGPANVCMDMSGSYTNTTAGGAWSSSDASIAMISSSGVLTTVAAGSVTISYSLTGSCSGHFVTKVVNVQPQPSPGIVIGYTGGSSSSGSGSGWYCNGDTGRVILTGADAGGVWVGSLVTIDAGTGFFTVHGSDSTTYGGVEYTVTNIYGCSALVDASLTISPTPPGPGVDSVVGPTTMVVGEVATYRSMVSHYPSGVSDAWFIASGTSGTLSGVSTITAAMPGSFTLVHQIFTACGERNTEKIVNVSLPSTSTRSTAMVSYELAACGGGSYGVGVYPHSAVRYVINYYGDGTIDTMTFTGTATDTVYLAHTHYYSYSGAYTLRHVLVDASYTHLDSTTTSISVPVCNDVALSFYYDANSNCLHDSSEHMNFTPFRVEVDSNGVAIDTVSVTSGLYFRTTGPTGTVYSFKALAADSNFIFSCLGSGTLYDTVGGSYFSSHRDVAIQCMARSSFDLEAASTSLAGRHSATGSITVHNLSCTATSGVVTLHFSSRYRFDRSSPRPTSVSGSTATWNFSSISSTSVPVVINYFLTRDSAWLRVGDTVHTSIDVTPVSGDLDTSNNHIERVDTVTASFDPNAMTVTPQGSILNGTTLHYGIEFENDGNAPAQNIYVMDTLDDNLNPSTLVLEGNSAIMNTTLIRAGGHNIMRFDFPNINLADSTHHDSCTGFVFYRIKPYGGLASGTYIHAHSGIFFDDNEVVPTNVTTNVIFTPSITIATTHADSACRGDSILFTATATTGGITHFHWTVNGVAAGSDSDRLSMVVIATDTIACTMNTTTGDVSETVNSNRVIIRVLSTPTSGSISGIAALCIGAHDTLSETVTGGVWSVRGSAASVSTSGILTGLAAGTDTVIYTVSNMCGTATARAAFSVAAPITATISGDSTICVGVASTFTGTPSGGTWLTSSGTIATVTTAGVVSGVASGSAVITYQVGNACGISNATEAVTSMAAPVAGTISGTTNICIGSTSTLTVSGTSGGAGTWSSASTSIANVSSTGIVTPVATGTTTINFSVTNYCGSDNAAATINVQDVPFAGIITGIDSVCHRDSMVLADTVHGGVWAITNSALATVTSSGKVVAGSTSGVDTVMYIVNNTCGSDTSIFIFRIARCEFGVETIAGQNESITCYPNPGTGHYTVVIKSATQKSVQVKVADIFGRKVSDYQLETNKEQSLDINGAPGVYYLNVPTGGYQPIKVIKE